MEGDVHGGAIDASRMVSGGGLVLQENIKELIQQIEQRGCDGNTSMGETLNEMVETSVREAHEVRMRERDLQDEKNRLMESKKYLRQQLDMARETGAPERQERRSAYKSAAHVEWGGSRDMSKAADEYDDEGGCAFCVR